MIIGADVCHDTQDKSMYGKRRNISQSTVGFCATYDSTYTQYHSFVSLQNKNDELMYQAKQLTINALTCFKQKNGQFPQNIIIYVCSIYDHTICMYMYSLLTHHPISLYCADIA